MTNLLSATLSHDYNAAKLGAAVERYGRDFEDRAGEQAARVMQAGMTPAQGDIASRPGGFPHSVEGGLRDGIDWARDSDGVLVGPALQELPEGYSLLGADTIPDALNRGGTVVIQRRTAGRRRPTKPRRIDIKPRPFVYLTLEIIAGQLAEIAQRTPLNED